MLWLVIVALTPALAAGASRVPRSCGPCEPAACPPLPPAGCALRVLDACACCELCAAGTGEPCGVKGGAAARCAPGMDCVKVQDGKKTLVKRRDETGVCECKAGNYEVCGSDLREYRSVCELRAASTTAERAHKAPIKVLNKGKCARAPKIITAPGEVWNVTGAQVYLSCEATGFPTPVLTWRKISNDKKKSLLLPGDQSNLAVQVRGGPEKHEVTGWVLISPLTKMEAGTYECHVSNSKGEDSAIGSIGVVDSFSDIPTKNLVKEAEL